ncbi:MAG TPA: PCP reductase family protein [Candidatus Dormibacteraeota bacterium]|jgi:Proto-chlorophyllide reductase 57 kD subunit|nr:PCP reductase family protein [Candidatus Dormibacteraeota bacterium]
MDGAQGGRGGCPFPHPPRSDTSSGCPVAPGWDEGTREHAEEIARRAAGASGLSPDRAADMAVRAVESRADAKRLEAITELFVRSLGRKLGYGHPLSDRTGTVEFTWTPEAEARLADVPEFCRDLTRWRVEWTAHKLGLGTTITPEVMEVKYEMWGKVSHAIREREREGLPWTDEALARFERIPDFVQGQVLEAVEGNARGMGATLVDGTVVDAVIRRWIDTGDFHEGLYGFR